MRQWLIEKGKSVADLRMIEALQPQPGRGEVLVRVHACSLNYRDHGFQQGSPLHGALARDTVPLSDGAGVVVALGDGVSGMAVGERVASTYFTGWADGPTNSHIGPPKGGPDIGMLSEYVALAADGLVKLATSLSFEEAACLPCAGVTAWNALMEGPRPVRDGDSVLVIGTGGVSLAALQIAKAAGARVVAISSSDEKLERVRSMGADAGINYRKIPEWGAEAVRLMEGGFDHIIEVGGPGTLAQSLIAVGCNSEIALIGVLGGVGANPPALHGLVPKGSWIRGIYVGSRIMAQRYNEFIDVHGIKPVIDRIFPIEQALDAYAYQASPKLFGKVVIGVA